MLQKGKGQKSIIFSYITHFRNLLDSIMVWINRCWLERPCTPFIPAVRVLTWSIAKGQVWFATHSDRDRLARMSCHLCPAAEIILWGGCMANSGALHILSISSAISASNKTRLMFWCDHENSQEKSRKKLGKEHFQPREWFCETLSGCGREFKSKKWIIEKWRRSDWRH